MERVINITNLRKDLYNMALDVIKNGSVINVTSKEGTFVMLSKEDYDALIETLYLSANPAYHQSLIDAKNAGSSEFIDEKDVKW